ncbi:MAG: hypothetical protein O2955_03885 [Planctomycetota bacterium]|nr:hypothetical protein [Planctomycetota bacterium]MDA1211629.1 hypothetical protein [Planctomycetota bacterium]
MKIRRRHLTMTGTCTAEPGEPNRFSPSISFPPNAIQHAERHVGRLRTFDLLPPKWLRLKEDIHKRDVLLKKQ